MAERQPLFASSWDTYRILADNSIDVVLEADPTTTFTWVSPSVTEVLGWRPDQLIGWTAADLVHPEDLAGVREHAAQMNAVDSPDRVGQVARRSQIRIATANGGYRRLGFRARPVVTDDGEVLRHVITLRDTSERDEALRALSVLTETNRVIAFAEDEGEVLARMCETIAATGHYPLVWFGEPQHDEDKSVAVRAIAGTAHAYGDGVRVSWADVPAGQGPTGRCLRSGTTTAVDDVRSDPEFAPWRDRALQHGLQSSIALPVVVSGTLRGALMVYSAEPHAFDAEARGLFETLASDLGLGLERLRTARLLKEQSRLLSESEARYRLLAEHSSDVVLQAPAGGDVAWASESCRAVLGWDPEAVVGKGIGLIHPDDVESALAALRAVARGLEAEGEVRVICGDGGSKWMGYRAERVRTPQGDVDIFSLRDIDREVRARQQLDFALGHDPLTGMSTQPVMQQRIADALRQLKPGQQAAVLCLSIDRLSAINEAFTHSAGDLVLTTLATRLVETVGHPDRVGRGKGVEFLILVPELAVGEVAAQLAHQLLNRAREPYHLGDTRIDATASVGIALGRSTDDSERLIRDASAAMGRAKDEGRDRAAFSDPQFIAQAQRNLHVEQRIKEALDRGLFVAHFQPIIDLATGEVSGYEALVRGRRDGGRPLAYPSEFMPVAERSGLVCDVDLVVMRAGLAALASLPAPLTVSVNISAPTLSRPGHLDQIRTLVQESGVRPSRLHLEVTETSLLGESEVIMSGMAALADIGARWYVDDFGTGYSSISHLRDLPISGLKLDVTFSQGIREGHSRSIRLANALVGMARGLGLDTVAEGIETEAEAEILLGQGWRHGQGYLYGKAEPLD